MAQLATDGFIHIPGCCDDTFTTHILDVSRRRIREIKAALGDREIGIGSAAGYHEIVQRSRGRWDLPITPQQFGTSDRHLPWWPLVAAVLGNDAEHSFSGVVFSEAGSPAQCWHIDSPHIHAEHRAPHALNVLVALHDVSMDTCGTAPCRRTNWSTSTPAHRPAALSPRQTIAHRNVGPVP
jgi:hypothetical protein